MLSLLSVEPVDFVDAALQGNHGLPHVNVHLLVCRSRVLLQGFNEVFMIGYRPHCQLCVCVCMYVLCVCRV